MYWTTTTLGRLSVVITACAWGISTVAGCGSGKSEGDDNRARHTEPAPPWEIRARQVADAWDGSQAAEMWHQGFYPMGKVVQVPEGGLHDEADQRAYETGNFDLDGDLPDVPQKHGRASWHSGGSLPLRLMGAQWAYKALDRDSSPGRRLTVTGAELGEMTVMTSRGKATVPAWLFTLKGYDAPLKRAAVIPSKLPESPIKPAGRTSTDVLAPLGGLVRVTAAGRSVTVVANHGSCDDGPTVNVLETRNSVVLSAATIGTREGACTSEMRGERLTVRLDRPTGNRILLDAFAGRPVPYSKWPKTSPGWS